MIKPFEGVTRLYTGEFGPDEGAESLITLLQNMGYIFYECPYSDSDVIISDRKLTYGDLKSMAEKLDLDPRDIDDFLSDGAEEMELEIIN